MELNKIYNENCLETMKRMPDNYIHAIVSDPPYGFRFMGKEWDYDVPSKEIFEECLRVLKPGGYLLAFSGARTYHRMAVNIEDAGFEIRNMIEWVYGSGFPKSLDISKAIDNYFGEEREVVGEFYRGQNAGKSAGIMGKTVERTDIISNPSSDLAKHWDGWGTDLKPAHEPVCMARKPLSEKTVALNVMKHETGGINIDACRVGIDKTKESDSRIKTGLNNVSRGKHNKKIDIAPDGNGFEMYKIDKGRFPANLIHDGSDCVLDIFPETHSGEIKPTDKVNRQIDINNNYQSPNGIYGKFQILHRHFPPSSGLAARFFYCAKVSPAERGESRHPTMKPIDLMKYLITMVSRDDQIIYDPFMGSGTTAIAAHQLGRRWIGSELSSEYCEIANKRIEHFTNQLQIF